MAAFDPDPREQRWAQAAAAMGVTVDQLKAQYGQHNYSNLPIKPGVVPWWHTVNAMFMNWIENGGDPYTIPQSEQNLINAALESYDDPSLQLIPYPL